MAYEITSELRAAHEATNQALDRAKRLRDQVDASALKVQDLEREVAVAVAAHAECDVERALATDDEVKGLDQRLKKLEAAADSKTRELNRERVLIETLERKAPQVDSEVRAAGAALNLVLDGWRKAAAASLGEELEAAAAPLLRVLAKARVVNMARGSAVQDMLLAMYLPKPGGNFMYLGGYAERPGENLLSLPTDKAGEEAAAVIAGQLQPIMQTLSSAQYHNDYVPLAKRPKRYVLKGYTHEGVKGDERPFGNRQAQPEQQPSRTQGPAPLAQASGFKRKHHSDGTPIDGDMGHQQVDNLMRSRGEGGSEFAV